LRAGELAWAEIPVAKDGRPIQVPPPGTWHSPSTSASNAPVRTALWPVQIVDRWISRGDEDDPKSQAIRAISDDGLVPFRVSGPGRVDILNTLALFKSSRVADLRNSVSDLEALPSAINTSKFHMDVDEESVNADGNANSTATNGPPETKAVYDIAAEDDEIEDCFYRPAPCVMPFSMFNPDCRDDIRWNVAALQALDVATTWGVPSKEEDFAEIEEVGVWADVIEDMGVPERPDQTISNAAGDPLLNNPVGPVRKRRRIVSQSSPPSKPVALHEGALDGPAEDFVHKSRKVNLQPETRRRVWGLVKKYENLDRLFSVIRKSPKWKWAGDDPHMFPDLRTDERLLERFRLGADRVQVGDLVRLATVGGLTSQRIQPPQPSRNKSSRTEKVISSSVPALIMSRQELLKLTSGKDSGEVFNHSSHRIHDSQANGTTAPNDVTHLARGNAGALQTPENSDTSATSDNAAVDPAAASAATSNSTSYALDIPHIDPADYLEVTHIILRRPRLPVSEPPLEAPRKYALNESNPYRPTVRLVGRVYKRVPAARDDWMRARTRTVPASTTAATTAASATAAAATGIAGASSSSSSPSLPPPPSSSAASTSPSATDGASPVPLWLPTGEVRSVDVSSGLVVCRAHAQFAAAPLGFAFGTGGAAVAGAGAAVHHHDAAARAVLGGAVPAAAAAATWATPVVVGGVGPAWRGGPAEGSWDGNWRFERERSEVAGFLAVRLATATDGPAGADEDAAAAAAAEARAEAVNGMAAGLAQRALARPLATPGGGGAFARPRSWTGSLLSDAATAAVGGSR
ncbi:hypothetical protein HK405_003643, partial [Cladochytrium tenue]